MLKTALMGSVPMKQLIKLQLVSYSYTPLLRLRVFW
jgi:hypothetical protein